MHWNIKTLFTNYQRQWQILYLEFVVMLNVEWNYTKDHCRSGDTWMVAEMLSIDALQFASDQMLLFLTDVFSTNLATYFEIWNNR